MKSRKELLCTPAYHMGGGTYRGGCDVYLNDCRFGEGTIESGGDNEEVISSISGCARYFVFSGHCYMFVSHCLSQITIDR